MTVKTFESVNFRRLMVEVQRGDTSPEGAAAMIDEYILSEVARRANHSPDVELGLHPLNTVQMYADRLSQDQDRLPDRMVATLVREYAMLRRRMADDRLKAMAETAPPPKPTLPPKLRNAEAELFDSLRAIDLAQKAEQATAPDRRQKDRRTDK